MNIDQTLRSRTESRDVRGAVRSLVTGALLGLGCMLLAPDRAAAQTTPDRVERLRRDQDEILHKAERLQKLMERLQQRYEREGKKEQVKLLAEGLAHLERSGVLREVASIRDDLSATAFTEALRKQKDVVDDLERLLNILLERKSVENLDQQMQVAAEQAATARELEQRQRNLIDATRNTLRTEPNEAEKKLIEDIDSLRQAEQREAQRNARDAGTRRPFLESALQRIEELLRQEDRLDNSLRDEAAGRAPAARERQFDLGHLTQQTRELQGQLRDQLRQQDLGDAASKLREQAAGSDQQALQQARDRLEAQLRNPPLQPDGPEGPSRDPRWAELRNQLEQAPAGATESERAELNQLAAAGEQLAEERNQQAGKANTDASGRLQAEAGKLAERLRAEQPAATAPDADTPAKAVADAQQRLAEAQKASEAGDAKQAMAKVNQALSSLERARAEHQKQNPDAVQQAGEMAAEAAAAAQELQNTPGGQDAEQKASEQLRDASEALRKTGAAVQAARDAGRRPEVPEAAANARADLEAAQKALQQALAAANQGGSEDLQAAAERQQQLQQRAQQAGEQLQQAAAKGQITPEQQKAANEQLQKAQARMEKATARLQSGQQASASPEQQAAADALQKAADALQENKPLTEAQKQAMQAEAAQQEQLAEDIVRLAQELKQRDNKAAEQAVQQAADAARKAKRALEEGDADETQKQQEQARQKLEEAAKELEDEKDRYQDLRQEELLFRMKDELTNFLDKQRPLTAQTEEVQKATAPEGLSRPARRKLNQVGEEEQALASKVEFLVNALTEEGNLVYQAVLKANLDDVREVARRLAGRSPDPGNYTTMLQKDVERRTEELLEALERERKRREQERQQQQQDQQGQQQGQNRFNPQREKLVSLIAELEMLKQLGADTRRSTDDLRTLVEVRGDEVISDAEVALIERLAHRHAEITKLFQQIKRGIEEAMQGMQGDENQQDPKEPAPKEKGRGR